MTLKAVFLLALGVLAGLMALGKALAWSPLQELPRPVAVPAADAPATADSTVADWAERAPFRRGRRPSTATFDARAATVTATVEVTPPRPHLVLQGILFGTEPSGIVEGFPGSLGPRAVRVGDTVAGLRVSRITAAMVVIQGRDTTWQLHPPGSGDANAR